MKDVTTVAGDASKPDAATVLARQDRIPIWALPYSYLVVIGIGYFFTFFDIADIGFAMPAIAGQFKLTDSQTLFVALSVGLAGYIIGSIVIGGISDRIGRYRTLIITLSITAVGSFLDATATGIVTLSVWRFVTGIGVGADLNLVSTYIGELSPAARRGRISTLTFLIGIVGQAVTPFIALALVPNFSFGWRLLFVAGGLIATVGVLARFHLPESPRWLALHGRVVEADAIVSRMEARAAARGVRLAEPRITEVSDVRKAFPYSALFSRPYGGRLALLVSMWFFWYIGNYGFLGDAATLIAEHGYSIAGSILFIGVGSIGYPAGALVMAWLADRIERRLHNFGSTVVWLAGMVLIGVSATDAVLALGSFLASFALGLYLQVAYTYTAELFPTRARSSGFSLSDGIGHAGGALGALVLPVVVASTSFMVGFVGIGVTGLVAGLIALLGPRTSRYRLEQVSR